MSQGGRNSSHSAGAGFGGRPAAVSSAAAAAAAAGAGASAGGLWAFDDVSQGAAPSLFRDDEGDEDDDAFGGLECVPESFKLLTSTRCQIVTPPQPRTIPPPVQPAHAAIATKARV